MRFLAFLDGANGVRGFVVANLDGEILAEKGARSGLDWAPSRIVCVAQDLAVAGALVGLGAFSGAALKSAKSSRLIAHNKEAFALVDLEPSQPTLEYEEVLRSREWVSSEDSREDAPTLEVTEEEPATVRPAPPALRPPPKPTQAASAQGSPSSSKLRAAAPLGRPTVRPASEASVSRRPVLQVSASRATHVNASAAAVAVVTTNEMSSQVLPVGGLVSPPSSGKMVAAASVTPPLLTGSLRLFSLPDLLEFLRVGQRTGTLVCASPEGLGTIELRRGRIFSAVAAGVATLEEFVVQSGALSQADLDRCLGVAKQVQPTATLPTLLLTEKLVERDLMHELLMSHVVRVLRHLMGWEAGEFSFDPAPRPDALDTQPGIDLDPQGVLLNIFKDMDDAQRS